MASIHEELESFTQFARQRIQADGPTLSMDELYEQWREGHPASDDAAAILASLRDMEQGAVGRDFAAFAEDFSKRSGIPEAS